MSTQDYLLYGVEGSYYAAKLRCYLLQKGLPFREVQCDRAAFSEVIIPRVGYPIVPVLITPNGETLQDTAETIDELEQRHPNGPLVPQTPARRTATYLLELYADEWLKLPALHYRWFYDYEFAHLMMGYNNDPDASVDEQRRVGAKIARQFSQWPEHLGVTSITREAVETDFLVSLSLLDQHFSQHPYALGAQPTLADCALMGPLYAHLYRDPHSGRIVRQQAAAVCQWIERMRRPVDTPTNTADGSDSLPETIVAVLKQLSRDCVPTLIDAAAALERWFKAHPQDPVPRYAGTHEFTLGLGTHYAASGLRSIHPFEHWKVQRLQHKLSQSGTGADGASSGLLSDIGAAGLLNVAYPTRLQRQQYRLVRANTECSETTRRT